MDKTMARRGKRVALNGRSRPREQRWVRRAVEQGRFDERRIRSLLRPKEALAGKPRRREEVGRGRGSVRYRRAEGVRGRELV